MMQVEFSENGHPPGLECWVALSEISKCVKTVSFFHVVYQPFGTTFPYHLSPKLDTNPSLISSHP